MGREETKSTKDWREDDESVQLRIPVEEAPHFSREKLLHQYVDIRVGQAKALFKMLFSMAGILVVLPHPVINLLVIPFGFVIGFELRFFKRMTEFTGIVFSRHNIPYPKFKG